MDPSADVRVIEAGAAMVEAGCVVVEIASVSERVSCSDVCIFIIEEYRALAPFIVGIFYNSFAVPILPDQ